MEEEDLSASKRWMMTNSSSQSRPEVPAIHFICEEIIYESIYDYLQRTKKTEIRIDSFQTFDHVISLLKTDRVSHRRDLLNSSYYSSMRGLDDSNPYQSATSLHSNSSLRFPHSESSSNISLRQKLSKLKKNE